MAAARPFPPAGLIEDRNSPFGSRESRRFAGADSGPERADAVRIRTGKATGDAEMSLRPSNKGKIYLRV